MRRNNYRTTKRKNPFLEQNINFTPWATNEIQIPFETFDLRYDHDRQNSPRIDPENMATKWITDALVDCKILLDDGYKNIPEGVLVTAPKIVNNILDERVIITIRRR